MSTNSKSSSKIKKLYLAYFVCFICFGGLFTVWYIYDYVSNEEKHQLAKLKTISDNVALKLNGDTHAALTAQNTLPSDIFDNTSNSDYKHIHATLREAYLVNQLESPIYTLFREANSDSLYLGVTSSNKPYFRNTFRLHPKELLANYSIGGSLAPYTTEKGRWLSAYSPIKDKNDQTVGLVQVDKPYQLYNQVLIMGILKKLSALFIASIGLVILLLLISNKMNVLFVEQERSELQYKIKSQFLSAMHHEIRTPLNGILGVLSMVLEKELHPEQKRNLITVEKSAKLLKAIVNDSLDYSKLESGKVRLNNRPENFENLVAETVNSFQAECTAKGLHLGTKIDPKIAEYLLVDEVRLKQVLTNLIGNSVKFTAKGYIRIEVRLEKQDDSGQLLSFQITDSGRGIAQDKIQTVLKSFQQADTDTQRRYGGSGLGLNITKKILELYESDLYVQSTENQGSTFGFDLKLRTVSTAQIEELNAAKEQIEHYFNQQTVLVVEDNKINMNIAKHLLLKWNLNVIGAYNGKEAIAILEEHPVDFILMDLEMPVMNGYETTNRIRQDERTEVNTIPIVAFTANTSKEFHYECLNHNMDGLVEKPFEKLELNETIYRFLVKKNKKTSISIKSKSGYN